MNRGWSSHADFTAPFGRWYTKGGIKTCWYHDQFGNNPWNADYRYSWSVFMLQWPTITLAALFGRE